jgi:hypothetical protein
MTRSTQKYMQMKVAGSPNFDMKVTRRKNWENRCALSSFVGLRKTLGWETALSTRDTCAAIAWMMVNRI